MAPKVPMHQVLHLSKRLYSSTAIVQPAAVSTMSRMATATESSGGSAQAVAKDQEKKEVFWMKDPETGNWIPENHFGEVDVADLREKLLNKHKL